MDTNSVFAKNICDSQEKPESATADSGFWGYYDSRCQFHQRRKYDYGSIFNIHYSDALREFGSIDLNLATSNMGFGGVGESGMGAYHGKTGFDTFTHDKSIVDKKTWMDLPMRYQPYNKLGDWLIHVFLR